MDEYDIKRCKTLPIRLLNLLYEKGLIDANELYEIEYPSEEELDKIHWSEYI
jgi:hypothetical protein